MADHGYDVADPRDVAPVFGDLAEFDRLLQADPNDAEAKAGRAQAGLFARAAALDPQTVLARAEESDAVDDQLAAADVEMLSGQAEAAFARLTAVVRTRPGPDRDALEALEQPHRA